jgi:hypothetical protein
VRRRRRLSEAPPERLCRFVWPEWPGYEHEAQAFSQWTAARFDWLLDHPDIPLPGDQDQDAAAMRARRGLR